MKNKIVKILVFSIIIAVISFCNTYMVYGATGETINEENVAQQFYNVGNSKVLNEGQTVAGYILYAGIIIAVIVLMQKGIKFITASPEGKAEVKKEIIPWVVGIVLLLSLEVAIQFFVDFAQENVNNLTI